VTVALAVGQSALLTDLAMCVNYYRLFTPGVYCCTFAPVQLDDDTRLCLGLIAMINSGKHKQCTADPPLGVSADLRTSSWMSFPGIAFRTTNTGGAASSARG